MYEQSHRDYLRSGYLHHQSSLSWAVNQFDNAITYKAQRDKNARELKLANMAIAAIRCVSVLLRSMQNTPESCDAKLKMMLCVMMLPLVVVGCHQQSVSQCVKPPPPAWILQPPPTGGHR